MEHEEPPPIFSITDASSTRYGNTLTGQFFMDNKIALSSYQPITSSTRDQLTEYADKDPINIYLLQQQFIFDEPILRSLIAESNSTFVALQNLKGRGSSGGTLKLEFIKISRMYRSILRACLEKLQEAAKKAEMSLEINDLDTQKLEMYQRYISMFYSIECIWHLTEILYLEPTQQNTVVPQLLDWIRFHFPTPERMATDLILYGRDASDHEDYWPAVKGLIMQGQIEAARAILRIHPSADIEAFRIVDKILESMPTIGSYTGFSAQKFRSQWQFWLTDTERKLATNVVSVQPYLEEIILLITNDPKIWNAQIKESEYWYDLLPGYLLYTNPACKHFELGDIAHSWIDRWARSKGSESDELQIKLLDRVILKLMENDIHEVMQIIQKMADSQWVATHLSDLLYHADKLRITGEHQVSETAKLRDSLVYEFGSCLMTRNSLWQLGMDYLDYCGKEGLAAQELLLAKIPLRTEKHALKIMGVAEQKGFHQVGEQICKVLSKKSLAEERYGNALEWALRSKDTLYVTSIADFILNHYSKTGDMLCPDVIANIGAKMFISPRLVFLVKYFDFYQLYRKRDFLPAAELLVNLLESKITPEYFWPSLLIHSIPLLESKDPKIMSKETCVILNHLESELVPLVEKTKKRLQKCPTDPVNILKDYRIENIEEIINPLRLACARNLSRAIIIENSCLLNNCI